MTKRIKQKGEADCGIASFAMLLDLPYTTVKKVVYAHFGISRKKKFDGLNYYDDIALAKKFGIRLKLWQAGKNNRKKLIADLVGRKAILVVPTKSKKPQHKDGMHAVYWNGDKLLDPNTEHIYHSDGIEAMAVFNYAMVVDDE